MVEEFFKRQAEEGTKTLDAQGEIGLQTDLFLTTQRTTSHLLALSLCLCAACKPTPLKHTLLKILTGHDHQL